MLLPINHRLPEGFTPVMSPPYILYEAPGRLPILGHLLRIRKDPLAFFRSLQSLGDVVTFGLGPSKAYLVTRPNLIRHMLCNDVQKFDKGVQFEKARPFLGNGLVTSSEPLHMRQRRLMKPAFHSSQVAHYALEMQKITEERIGAWRSGREIALDRELHVLTLTIVVQALFSTDVNEAFAGEILSSIPPLLAGIARRTLLPFQLLEKLPTRANREFESTRIRLSAAIRRIISERAKISVDRGDLLSLLREAGDEGADAQAHEQQIFDEVMSMLLAGTGTSANVLGWTCHLLGAHQEVQARVAKEVDDVLAGRPARAEDLAKLDLTRRALTEGMRLYPPVWLVSRRPIVAVEIGGHQISAGSHVLFCPYAIHRDPALYAEPDRFDPDRWKSDSSQRGSRTTFLPFGAGIRSCLGEGFAWTEMLIILSAVIGRWTLLPVADCPVRPAATTALQPVELFMRLQGRTRSQQETT